MKNSQLSDFHKTQFDFPAILRRVPGRPRGSNTTQTLFYSISNKHNKKGRRSLKKEQHSSEFLVVRKPNFLC